jgi:hypothetical protein
VTHIFIFLLGLWLLFLVLRSMIRIALMNRHYRDFFAEITGRAVYSLIALRLRRKRDANASHRILLTVFPTYVLSLILVYFIGAMIAFSFLYWGSHAVNTWGRAFLASGSALNTLGFATPATITGQWLAVPEGALGLGIVVFLFTFIPGYQAVIRAREDRTSWLYARVSAQPTGAALLEWLQRAGVADDMRSVWEAWEDWFRMLGDTHSVLPMLTLSPSVQTGQSWVSAAAAVLDAAALAASSGTRDAESAKICVRTGARAFVAIADALGRTCAATKQEMALPQRERYEAARNLGPAGMPLKVEAHQAIDWEEFSSLRIQYEESLLFVAQRTFVSGDTILLATMEG